MTEIFQSTRPVQGATHITPWCWWITIFQSTRPVQGATVQIQRIVGAIYISIHAPRAGRDRRSWRPTTTASYFNPRAPCRARLLVTQFTHTSLGFQSTRPVQGATEVGHQLHHRTGISIHAPRAGRDLDIKIGRRVDYNFNPRAPCRARQVSGFWLVAVVEFQSTRPVQGATMISAGQGGRCGISIHAPRAGRDLFIV